MTIENKYLLRVKKLLRDKNPVLLTSLASFYYGLVGFKLEKAYLKGRLRAQTQNPSLLLISCNRAATQFVEEVLKKIYEYDGGLHIALNRYLFFFGAEHEALDDVGYMSQKMVPQGFFYGQQGPFHDHSIFDEYKMVVMSRDPRDLLVSHFHSFTKAHIPRDEKFVKKVEAAQRMGLQNYVLLPENIEYFTKSLEQSVRLRNQRNVLFYKYENMMDDFPAFQEACQQFIYGKVNPELSALINPLYRKPEKQREAEDGSEKS